jgi:hypothetical protein
MRKGFLVNLFLFKKNKIIVVLVEVVKNVEKQRVCGASRRNRKTLIVEKI